MYKPLVRWIVRRVLARSRTGDMGPSLALWAADGHFRFPGQSSWTADYHRKADIERWYERFARVGIQLEPEDILVNGGPWNTRVCVHFTDHAAAPDGTPVYENRGVLFLKMAWGKVRFGTVYEDTQKVAAFDEYLAAHALATTEAR